MQGKKEDASAKVEEEKGCALYSSFYSIDETVAFKKAAPGMDISSKERKKEHRGSMKNARVKKLGSKKAFFDI